MQQNSICFPIEKIEFNFFSFPATTRNHRHGYPASCRPHFTLATNGSDMVVAIFLITSSLNRKAHLIARNIYQGTERRYKGSCDDVTTNVETRVEKIVRNDHSV